MVMDICRVWGRSSSCEHFYNPSSEVLVDDSVFVGADEKRNTGIPRGFLSDCDGGIFGVVPDAVAELQRRSTMTGSKHATKQYPTTQAFLPAEIAALSKMSDKEGLFTEDERNMIHKFLQRSDFIGLGETAWETALAAAFGGMTGEKGTKLRKKWIKDLKFTGLQIKENFGGENTETLFLR